MALIITAIIILILIAVATRTSDKKKKRKPAAKVQQVTVTITETPADLTWYGRIAGVVYHVDKSDVGGFMGYVAPDPDNEHDPDACAVYRNGGKLVGYIPKADLSGYRKWSEAKPLPCIGYIAEGDEVDYYGKVKVINGDLNDPAARLVLAKFVLWLIENYGLSFKPKDVNVEGRPLKTEEEWIEALEEYIDENE